MAAEGSSGRWYYFLPTMLATLAAIIITGLVLKSVRMFSQNKGGGGGNNKGGNGGGSGSGQGQVTFNGGNSYNIANPVTYQQPGSNGQAQPQANPSAQPASFTPANGIPQQNMPYNYYPVQQSSN